jgi:hypothetical protein
VCVCVCVCVRACVCVRNLISPLHSHTAGADGDPALLDAARLLAEAVAKMLKGANDVALDPDDEKQRLLYASARDDFDATQGMQCVRVMWC